MILHTQQTEMKEFLNVWMEQHRRVISDFLVLSDASQLARSPTTAHGPRIGQEWTGEGSLPVPQPRALHVLPQSPSVQEVPQVVGLLQESDCMAVHPSVTADNVNVKPAGPVDPQTGNVGVSCEDVSLKSTDRAVTNPRDNNWDAVDTQDKQKARKVAKVADHKNLLSAHSRSGSKETVESCPQLTHRKFRSIIKSHRF